MFSDKDRLFYLFDRYFQRTATPQECAELLQLIDQGNHDEELQQHIAAAWEKYGGEGEIISPQRSEAMLHSILRQNVPSKQPIVRKINSKTVLYRRMAAAAAVILVCGSLTWFFMHKKEPAQKELAAKTNSPVTQPINPGTNGAILTLDNGQTIVLDSIKNGFLTQQGNSQIIKGNAGLQYQANVQGSNIVYNTITTPRGRQYPNLMLADGSKVWLDAGSSIRFPVAFAGKERRVEITGQVWFDVIHDEKKPFIVTANNVSIYDLGTQFNVNAYTDEPEVKVSLLEGAIQIHSTQLRPGQQAKVKPNGALTVKDNADMDEAVAWKKGFFNFNNSDLQAVMRQLARWYDIKVSYEGAIPDLTFKGDIGRNLTLQELLEGLSFMNLKFRIEGKNLIILS